MLFRSLERSKLGDQVADQIRKLVLSGRVNPGDKLPPEREIASQMKVSRPVVREGLQKLETLGLIRRDRNGIWVCRLDIESYIESMMDAVSLIAGANSELLSNVWEVRHTLEVQIAGMAAENATSGDITQLKKIVQKQEKLLDNPKRYRETSFEFHQRLAATTKNKIFLFIITSLREVLNQYFATTLLVPGASRNSHAYHKKILQAVESRSPEKSRQAMGEHLEATRKLQNALLESQLANKEKE
jgi:GntR family transcriptional repressor for pyruvate dehydrogenase complex